MRWLLCLLPMFAWATSSEEWSRRWLTVSSVVERHPGYQNGDSLSKPPGTWQLLYAVIRSTHAPNGVAKDCLWVRVPTAVDGELKIVAVKTSEPCLASWDRPGEIHLKELKGIQFSQQGAEAQLWLTGAAGRVTSWKARFMNMPRERAWKLYDSSVGERAVPGVFFFAPDSELKPSEPSELVGELRDEYPASPCHFHDGSCQRCRFGVYAVDEGVGKVYFCGIERCGEKNQPACLRGKRWQRTREARSCRGDDSYLFCGPGLRVECEGERGICR